MVRVVRIGVECVDIVEHRSLRGLDREFRFAYLEARPFP
jgi:hypothetical protein